MITATKIAASALVASLALGAAVPAAAAVYDRPGDQSPRLAPRDPPLETP